MIKNKTLRGLALSAAVALGLSGLGTAPAYSAGLDNGFVSLVPDTGTEYTVIAKAGATFKLKANEASTADVGNIKFLVTDASGVVEPTSVTTARVGAQVTTSNTTLTSVTGSATLKETTFDNNAAHTIDAGSLIAFSANGVATAQGITASATTTEYSVASVSKADGIFRISNDAATTESTAVVASASANVRVLREPRNTTLNTYVVDTGVNSSATTEVLELTVPSDTTRVVTVVAWKDANDNGLIDSTEFASPVRTVTFIKASELTVTTTLSVVPGDTTLSAKVKTTPVLNGDQMISQDGDFLNAAFTRQDSAKTFYAPYANSKTAAWNDTTKEFSVDVSLKSGANVVASSTSANVSADTTSGLLKPEDPTVADVTLAKTSGSALITVTTTVSHNVRVGDKVTLADGNQAAEFNVVYSVTSVPAANKFTLAASTASGAISTSTASYDVDTYTSAPTDQNALVDRAFAGVYTAQAVINDVLSGAKATANAVSATSADLEFSTVGTASVQGSSDGSAILVKKGTLTVPVTVTVLDADEAAVSAGRPVVVSFTTAVTGVKVNDKTGAQTLTTDANGQVSFNVTSPAGAVGLATVSATAENSSTATGTFEIQWVEQSFGLTDLNGTAGSLATAETRSVVVGGSHTMNLTVMDQWYAAAPAGDYRVLVTGAGTTQGVRNLVDGKTEITITDNGFESAMSTTIALQKLTSGVWGTVSGKTVNVTTNVNKNTNSVVLAADGSSLYGATADLSSPVAVKALVAADYRLTTAAKPAYSWSAVVAGKVQNAGTSVGVLGAEVTITGPSSILFSNGSVDKIGSITVLSDASGHFSFSAISTTAQKDTVLTVTSLGKSATTKVTFTGTTTGGVGTSLVITAPDTVAPASTLQIKAKLTDTFGNAVASAPVRVTYTGPGIAFGALPTSVDALGELAFSVLLGGGDTGTITVVVSYDQNGDGDYVDAKDLNTTKTITVGAAAPATPVADQKVNAGSFKGYVAVYAKGYEGKRLSAKIGNDWVIVSSLGSNFERVVDFTGAGVDITVRIYIDRVLLATIPLTTK